ncbi:MAG: prepilin-type N-terminal cleavage/methylation domain-containing protein [Fibrobacter sp.]|nr:prepilin-type N-terminal cleavage/methylation domain-containing protein [Fibrobacter sp.]
MKKGFTLMELVVYMAIMGIIVLVAGQAFSNSTKFRVRTQNMIRATQEAENVATLFKADVAQMGAKSSLEIISHTGGEDSFSGIFSDVYIDPRVAGDPVDKVEDLSSFMLDPIEPNGTSNLNSFSFRRVRYGTSGRYEATEEIVWYLDGQVLSRRCLIINKAIGASDNNCAPKGTTGTELLSYGVEIATGVTKFQVQPAKPGVLVSEGEQIFPPSEGNAFKLVPRYGENGYQALTAGIGGRYVTLSNFASNFDPSTGNIKDDISVNEVYVFANTAPSGTWRDLCIADENNHFLLEQGLEYEISFNVSTSGTDSHPDDSQMFVPGVDHMAVGIRSAENDKVGEKIGSVEDFIFFPPTMEIAHSIRRSVRFTVPENTNACLAFTFSFFSPIAAGGAITIGNFKLKRLAVSGYSFDEGTYYVPVSDKKNVKAFKLFLQISRGGKNGEHGETGEIEMIVPTPSNGPED